jgi:hypothetical protein
VTTLVFFPSSSKGEECWWGHETRTRFTYGILWEIRIDKTPWRPAGKRTIGWYEKRKTTNGHMNCNVWASTNCYPWTKTPEQVDGAIKSRDGGGEVTSKPQNAKE